MSVDNKTKKAIDDLAGAGSADKMEGKIHEVSGKVKKAVGHATDNKKLEAKGKIQHAMGTVSAVAHGIVDAVAEGAHKMTDAVKHIVHHDDKPKK